MSFIENGPHARFFALTPFLLFIGLFVAGSFVFKAEVSPIFLCLMAIAYAVCFIFEDSVSFNKRIELFVLGSAKSAIISMCYIFILSTVLTHLLQKIGGTQSIIGLGLQVVPLSLLLPGFFTVVSVFATTIGSSMSAIAAFMPIGAGIATILNIDAALMAGIVVNGAMLGDNLSIISDTTIAATQTIGARMSDKFKSNILLVIPAFCATLFVLWYQATQHVITDGAFFNMQGFAVSWVSILPYVSLFVLALFGLDVLAVLAVSILLAMGIGVGMGSFDAVQATAQLLDGFTQSPGMQEVLILVLMISGLSALVEYNGGIEYVLQATIKSVRSSRSAEIVILLIGFFVNSVIAINTITILITGSLVKHIAERFSVSKQRAASLLDIATCISQGVLPYTPQLLLAASLAGIASMEIIPYLYYQWFLLVVTVISIIVMPKSVLNHTA